jgi:hypothetical protein
MKLGGAWCAGVWEPQKWMISTPGSTNSDFNTWFKLVPDPLGRDYLVMRAYITQRAHDVSADIKRSEVQTRVDQALWGEVNTYHWRMIAPKNLVNLGPDVYVIVLQCHDENLPGIPRRPTFDIAYHNGQLEAKLVRTANPSGLDVWQHTVTPGEEIEITVRAKWADGTNVDAADGVIELYFGDALVYSLVGEKNTHDDGVPSERYPPYLKAGVYQSQFDEPAWAGKDFAWYHVGSMQSNEGDYPATLRAIIDAGLSEYSARERLLLARAV